MLKTVVTEGTGQGTCTGTYILDTQRRERREGLGVESFKDPLTCAG